MSRDNCWSLFLSYCLLAPGSLFSFTPVVFDAEPDGNDEIPVPSNVQVFVRGNTAIVQWNVDISFDLFDVVRRFELTYELLDSTCSILKITHGISKHRRTFTLVGLIPNQRYRLYMVTITETGSSNRSEAVVFTTNLTDTYQYIANRSQALQLEEAIVLIFVVGLWMCAMFLFIKQWDNIRILQPQEPRFKHSPKNLDTITIVKKPQDSVIYKNYSRKMSLTMVEREKKLLRMNTVPIMENVASLHSMTSFKKTLPTIEMEEGNCTDTASITQEVTTNV